MTLLHSSWSFLRWVGTLSTLASLPIRDNAGAGHDAGSGSVILVHGLGRTARSMKRLEWRLEREGFSVVNVSYPSTRLSVEEAADWLGGVVSKTAADCPGSVHFVTHSLGGIVLRKYLATHRVASLGRVVMLAPPNRGSELAEKLKGNFLFRFATGPAGQQLGTGALSVPCGLGPAQFEVGVIAGDRSLNPFCSACFPGRNDGKVSVESTRLDGMRDFLVVHHTHTWLMWRRDVVDAIVCFLETGSFASL